MFPECGLQGFRPVGGGRAGPTPGTAIPEMGLPSDPCRRRKPSGNPGISGAVIRLRNEPRVDQVSAYGCRKAGRVKYHTAVPLGRGGMGEVVRAWDPTLNRHVALKFLHSDDPELEERMLREARAQARVSHPNICPVFEVGRHEGRVFIAMQLIDGCPLDEAARDLGVEEKVSLVKTVAEAIHAAHAAGLVHRDLKPANILVERTQEGELKPWVVDFGIARQREVEGATVTGQVLGTPGYLSPEQARGEVSTIDRRSDVFSLGVVLYELLCGQRPHRGDSDVEVLVSLLGSEPVPLRRRAPHVPRDLETVVMKCLEPDRDRRYASARALADDLGRFLDGEPVEARPVGVVRRLMARARRNRVAALLLAGAVVTVVVLLLALAGSWIRYTVRLREERDIARQARQEAESREKEATEISDSLARVFELADPRRSAGKELTARELLVQGERRLERELAGRPLRLASMLEVMATSYLGLGVRDEAERLARRALELRREAAGEESLEVASSLAVLGRTLVDEDTARAEECFRRALELRRKLLDGQDLTVARSMVDLADLLVPNGHEDEGEALNRKALAIIEGQGAGDTALMLSALHVEGGVRLHREDYEGAIATYTEELERRRRIKGPDDPGLAATLNNLAYAQRRAGRIGEAEATYRSSLEVIDRIWRRNHPNRLMVMLNLAAVLQAQGRDDELEALLRQVVDQRRNLVGDENWRVGSDLLRGIGRFLMQRGRWADAEAPVRQGLAIFEKALGPDHAWTALARGQLAACLFGLGRDREAAGLLASSLGVLESLDHASPTERFELLKDAEYLETAGRPDLAARFRAIAEGLERPARAAGGGGGAGEQGSGGAGAQG